MHPENSPTNHILRLLLRGAPIIIACTALVTVAAVLLSQQQDERFRATTQVFVDVDQLGSAIAELEQRVADPDRALTTQASVARIPAVLDRLSKSVPAEGRTQEDLLDATSVEKATNADILTFSAEAGSRRGAIELANEYAGAYVDYRRDTDTETLKKALADVVSQLVSLRGRANVEELVAGLQDRRQLLRERSLLRPTSAVVGRPASRAEQTQPQTLRNGILGAILGLLLGIALMLVRNSMNTRVTTVEEVEAALDLPLLARLAPPEKRLREQHGLAMLEDPESAGAEGYRMLAANLELANLDRGAKTILFTSALSGEGKSTTIANVAVSLARSGSRVILVDLDVRRPMLHEFLGVETSVGLADLMLGRATLSDALINVPLGEPGNNGGVALEGELNVLLTGLRSRGPAEFVRSTALTKTLDQLADAADVVLIDTPPLLHVSDGMTLTAKADAVVIAVRLPIIRRQELRELRRLLDGAPLVKLGFFVTGNVEADAPASYAYAYDARPEPSAPERTASA